MLVKEGFDPLYGARPLSRVIREKVLDELALDILDQKFILLRKLKLINKKTKKLLLIVKGSPLQFNSIF